MSVTRLPVVSGPVEGGKGWIFGSPIEGLRERGYVMEEYFLEGTAVSYAPVAGSEVGIDGLWEVEPAEEASYKTRAYVAYPRRSREVQRHRAGELAERHDRCRLRHARPRTTRARLRVGRRDDATCRARRPTSADRGHARHGRPARVGPGPVRIVAASRRRVLLRHLQPGGSTSPRGPGGLYRHARWPVAAAGDRDWRIAVGDAARLVPQPRAPGGPRHRRVPPHRALGPVPAPAGHEPRRELRPHS